MSKTIVDWIPVSSLTLVLASTHYLIAGAYPYATTQYAAYLNLSGCAVWLCVILALSVLLVGAVVLGY